MKDDKIKFLMDPAWGVCPSCKIRLALPKFTDVTMLQACPKCGAWSKGIKWLEGGSQECNKKS